MTQLMTASHQLSQQVLVDYPQTLLIHVQFFRGLIILTEHERKQHFNCFLCVRVTLRWPYTIGSVQSRTENANHCLGTIRCLLNRSIHWYSIRDRVSSVQSILPEVQVSVL